VPALIRRGGGSGSDGQASPSETAPGRSARRRLRTGIGRAVPALALSFAFFAASTPSAVAGELEAVDPPFESWEDDLFGDEEPLYHDSDPSWAEEDPGLDEGEGYAPLFPPLAPWDLDEPSLEEPVFAEPDVLEET